MSYLVLARKFRPQSYEDVVGQGHVTKTLTRAIEKGRIAHAYLFCGPRGVGKTTTARLLAKSLNCLAFDKPTAHPCNKCSSCKGITEGYSTDVLEIDGASHRGIEDARDLQMKIQYATSGRYKVIIIDEVHMLTKEAFNALLKTLEEPPPNVVFVFATTEPDHVPLTIISRCQRFDFRRVGPADISEHIKRIASKEGFSITDDAADFLALRAEGALRDSLSALDQILATEPDGTIDLDFVLDLLGGIPTESFANIARCVNSKNPAIAFHELEKLLERGVDPLLTTKGLLEHFRNALIAKSGAMPSDYPNKQLYDEISASFELTDILRITKILTGAYEKMRNSDVSRYILEQALAYLALLDSTKDIDKLLTSAPITKKETPKIVEQRPLSEKPQATQQTTTRVYEPTPLPDRKAVTPIDNKPISAKAVADTDDTSKNFFENVAHSNKALAKMLSDGEIIFDGTSLLLKLPKEKLALIGQINENADQLRALRDAAKACFGENTTFEFFVERPQQEELPREKLPEDVEKVLGLFSAKLD